jgi:hypothetical protein
MRESVLTTRGSTSGAGFDISCATPFRRVDAEDNRSSLGRLHSPALDIVLIYKVVVHTQLPSYCDRMEFITTLMACDLVLNDMANRVH